MSTPVSIQDGPFTTNTLVSKKFIFVYIFIIWISVLPLLIELYIFWKLTANKPTLFIIILPIQIFIGYIILVISSIFTSKTILTFINKIFKPKEGVFSRNSGDKNYYFWSLRAVIKKWPVWVSKFIPIPFINKLNLRWFHNDSEFIEIGKNVHIGRGCSIKASMIFGNYLIIKRIKIEDNVVIGSNSFIAPGTCIYKRVILGSMSVTKFNQKFKPQTVYAGFPPKIIKTHETHENDFPHSFQNLEEEIFNCTIDQIQNRKKKGLRIQNKKFVKNLNFNLLIFGIIYFLSNLFPFLGVFYFGIEFFFPNFLQSPNLFSVVCEITSLTTFLMTPFIFIILFMSNLLILTILIKIFYKIILYFNPVEEGTFHWYNKEQNFKNYFKHSFVLRYLKWKLQRSPFPWFMGPAFNFVKNCRFGKNTIIEDSYIAKEFLEVGNNVYLGKSLIANHLWDKNLTIKKVFIGDNVTISDACCIAPGTEVDDDVILLPLSVTAKYDKLLSNRYYYNAPLTTISMKELIQNFNLKINLNKENSPVIKNRE